MKTSFVSNLSSQLTLQRAITQAQKELQQRTAEASGDGRHWDVGVVLGAKTSRSLNMHRDLDRLTSLLSTNSLTETRLGASQAALDLMAGSAENVMSKLTLFKDSPAADDRNKMKDELKNALQVFTGAANTTQSGEYVFAGVNSDVEPFKDYLAAGSPAKVAFDTAFNDFMTSNGFTNDGTATGTPDPSKITPEAMQDFLTDLEASFNDDDYWKANWSNASDETMVSRISTGEQVQSSTTVNTEGVRKFAFGAVVAYELLALDLGTDTRNATFDVAYNSIANSVTGVNGEKTKLGISQERIKKANDSLNAQKDILTTVIVSLERVDLTEVSAQVKTLESQLELAFTLTARMQSLSLLNYL
ncbi:MAG: flagellar hook-associated family protein [Shinella sp.]|jgi:flagellar hook-associated protein 3 FlgL|nr:flagellar hook-associated family protein [Shinella sp.]